MQRNMGPRNIQALAGLLLAVAPMVVAAAAFAPRQALALPGGAISAAVAAAGGRQAAAAALAAEIGAGVQRAFPQGSVPIWVAPMQGRRPESEFFAQALRRALAGVPAVQSVGTTGSAAAVAAAGVVTERDSAPSGTGEPVSAIAASDAAQLEAWLRQAAQWGAKAAVFAVTAAAGTAVVEVRARVFDVGRASALLSTTVRYDPALDPTPVGLEVKTLDAQIRRLADRLAAGFDALDGEVRYQRFAVLPFALEGVDDERVGRFVAAAVARHLALTHRLMVAGRDEVASVLAAHAPPGAAYDSSTEALVRIGRALGAQAVVAGRVVGGTGAGAGWRVLARVVATDTAAVVVGEDAELPAAELRARVLADAVLRTPQAAATRSLLLPGWGQLYNEQPIKAGLFLGTQLALAAAAVTFQLHSDKLADRYDRLGANTAPSIFDALHEQRVGSIQRRNVLIIAAAGVYLLNVVDALLGSPAYWPSGHWEF